jgi:MFS family permease
MLLFLRIGTLESNYFKAMSEDKGIQKGNLKLIFFQRENLIKYAHCVAIGIPIWYVIGLLIMNSKDNFGPWLGVYHISNGVAVMYAYIGLSVGDLVSGFLSQLLKSRKKVVQLYLGFTLVCVISFLLLHAYNITENTYYFMCFLLGAGTGYWAIFVTIAAEQFGTNIRSTAANTIPNFVRGSVNLITLLFGIIVSYNISDGWAALFVGVLFIGLALFSITRLKETFGKDLDYIEIA